MAGKEKFINQIKIKANQFGLEAQPPAILAMVNGLKNFTAENLLKSFERKDNFLKMLNDNVEIFELTPTGVMVTPEKLACEVQCHLSPSDIAFIFSMILLKDEGIITIPAVSMPGASPTIRFDLSTSDAFKLELEDLTEKIISSFDKLKKIVLDDKKSFDVIFN